MYQIFLTTDGQTQALTEATADGNKAEHQLVEFAAERIWNFDEYSADDIEQMIKEGEARFGASRLFIKDLG